MGDTLSTKGPSEQNTLLKVMVFLLVLLVVFLGFVSGHQYYDKLLRAVEKRERKDRLTLVSPNGLNKVVIKATDDRAVVGLYHYEKENDKLVLVGHQIVLVNNGLEGSDFGLYNAGERDKLVGVKTHSGEPYPLVQGVDRNSRVWDILHRTTEREIGSVGEPPKSLSEAP